jgi:hypothetical protein
MCTAAVQTFYCSECLLWLLLLFLQWIFLYPYVYSYGSVDAHVEWHTAVSSGTLHINIRITFEDIIGFYLLFIVRISVSSLIQISVFLWDNGLCQIQFPLW